MGLRSQLRIPKEHGAWGMLYVSFALGALVAARGWGRIALLAAALTLVFIARESVLAWWHARTRGRNPGSATRLMVIYLAFSVVAGLSLVWRDHLTGMIPLGIAAGALLAWNAQQAAKREERTIFTEVLGIAGLCLAAPAAHYAGMGRWTPIALWLWVLSALYFSGSVFHVKLRVLSAYAKQPEPLARIRTQCTAYHAALAIVIGTLVSSGRLHWWILAAFAPVLLRALLALLRPSRTLVLRRIGWLAVLDSLGFLCFTVLAFRVS